jgi:hypothetical protein
LAVAGCAFDLIAPQQLAGEPRLDGAALEE